MEKVTNPQLQQELEAFVRSIIKFEEAHNGAISVLPHLNLANNWRAVPISRTDHFSSYSKKELEAITSNLHEEGIDLLFACSVRDILNKSPKWFRFPVSINSFQSLKAEREQFKFKGPTFITSDTRCFVHICDWDLDFVISEEEFIPNLTLKSINESLDEFEEYASKVFPSLDMFKPYLKRIEA